jgi:hypothetical protein
MEEESPTRDAEYLRGLREAVHQGVEYGIALLADEQERTLHFPIALISQARLAARQRIPLEMVIRRYLAGKTVLGDFMLQESVALDVRDPIFLRTALAAQDIAFDQLLALVTDEYSRERDRSASHQSPVTDRVQRLLAGEMVDSSLMNYDFGCNHLGVAIGSPEARQIIRQIAVEVDSRALIVNPAQGEVWAWLGSKQPLDPEAICRVVASVRVAGATIGVGESSRSLTGWRLTHRQARLAFSVAQASPSGFVRYADVAITVSAAQDPVLTASLQELYLSPLDKERDSGRVLRSTLRAYFSADRNSSSAAAALGVSRQTVTNRLRHVEEQVGQPLSRCADAVAAALRMEELGLLEQALDSP